MMESVIEIAEAPGGMEDIAMKDVKGNFVEKGCESEHG